MKQKRNIKMLCLTALFTALIAAGAFIRIPLGTMPITLQVPFVILTGMLLGKKYAFFSTALYVTLGLLGLPVFSQGGGIGYVTQPGFGYLLGFLLGAFVAGAITFQKKHIGLGRLLAANFAALGVIYGVALVYIFVLSNYVLHTPLGFGALLIHYFLLYIPGNAVCGVACAFLANRLLPLLRQQGLLPA